MLRRTLFYDAVGDAAGGNESALFVGDVHVPYVDGARLETRRASPFTTLPRKAARTWLPLTWMPMEISSS